MSERLYYYYEPQVRDVSVIRCNASGNEDDDGTYLKISATRYYATWYTYGPVYGETEKNFCEIRYRHRQLPNGSYSDWTTILAKDNLASNSVITGALDGTLDADESYEVIVGVLDDVGNTSETTIILPAGVFMHKDGEKNSIGIGELVEEKNTVSIAKKLTAVIKGLLKIHDGINLYDVNGKLGAYARSGLFSVQSVSGEFVESTMYADGFSVGDGVKGYASLNYDPVKNRGYVYIDGVPEDDTDATNKAYVDAKTSVRQVWMNTNPGGGFDAQTVALDLSAYSMVYIKFMYHTSTIDNAYCWWEPCPIGQGGSTSYTSLASGDYAVSVYRSFRVDTSGVTFGTGAFQQGMNTNVNDPSRAVPIIIYAM